MPIVFILGFDPVRLGVVQSLARPGANVTGFSIFNFELIVFAAHPELLTPVLRIIHRVIAGG